MKINEVRRTVPSFKLLNVTPKFMIYLSANRLRYICFAIVINYSHCKEHCVFKTKSKKASIPSGLFVYKKREIFEPYRLEILKLWLHTQIV